MNSNKQSQVISPHVLSSTPNPLGSSSHASALPTSQSIPSHPAPAAIPSQIGASQPVIQSQISPVITTQAAAPAPQGIPGALQTVPIALRGQPDGASIRSESPIPSCESQEKDDSLR